MNSPPPYRQLLGSAYDLGRTDGHSADDVEPEGPTDRAGGSCRGRGPLEFAAYLWHPRPGQAPAGLTLNAPLWYLQGFADGLADARITHPAIAGRNTA